MFGTHKLPVIDPASLLFGDAPDDNVVEHEALGQVILRVIGYGEVHPDVLRSCTELGVVQSGTTPRFGDLLGVGRFDDGRIFVLQSPQPTLSLRDVLRSPQALTPIEACAIAFQILDAMAAVHAWGGVCQQISTQMVLLEETPGGAWRVQIDPAIFFREEDPIDYIQGNPGVLAPEYIDSHHCSPAMDIYAAAVVLYESLTGQLPYEWSTPIERIIKICSEPPTPLRTHRPELPDSFDAFISKSMARDPHERFSDILAMAQDLERLCNDLVADATPFSVPMWSLKRSKEGHWETRRNALWLFNWSP